MVIKPGCRTHADAVKINVDTGVTGAKRGQRKHLSTRDKEIIQKMRQH
jgi:hypothetical protein